ncbi:MAG: HEAT repeat domain-containing protein [Bacteroidales bacterium]|nr:HEAT repeat domain-containing protein [Bacteroidales bacterium]
MKTTFDVENEEAPDNLSVLFSDLVDNPDFDTQHWAGELLARLGSKVLPQLNILLGSSNKIIRMEALKVIKLIGHRSSIPSCIASLEDSESEIRLIATEALILIGRECISPLLRRLAEKPTSSHLNIASHRVFAALITLDDPKNLHHLVFLLKHVADDTVTVFLEPAIA